MLIWFKPDITEMNFLKKDLKKSKICPIKCQFGLLLASLRRLQALDLRVKRANEAATQGAEWR